MIAAVRTISWNDVANICRISVPPLSFNSYKGQNGRIAVIGGSVDYTGAPYYAGQAALKFGADLAFIFCAKEAKIPIKSYSPELMVTHFYETAFFEKNSENIELKDIYENAEIVINFFPRISSFVIGPGLGRNKAVNEVVRHILSKAIESNKPLVIDADALWFLSQDLSIIKGYKKCILTPNAMEFGKLITSAISEINTQLSSFIKTTDFLDNESKLRIYLSQLSSQDIHLRLIGLCNYLSGVTILVKGMYDLVSNGHIVYVIKEDEGSPRRCGGQGDALAGCMAVAMHWSSQRQQQLVVPIAEFNALITHSISLEQDSCMKNHTSNPTTSEELLFAAILSSIVVKRASGYAYQTKKRSMTTPDLIENLGDAFENTINR